MAKKKTEQSNVVHFSVHGDFLTNLAREKWIEDTPKDAVNFLMVSLPGLPQELAIEILIGKKKLVGVNELLLKNDKVTELYGIPTSIKARWERIVPKYCKMLSEMSAMKTRMTLLVNDPNQIYYKLPSQYRTGAGYDNGSLPFSLDNDRNDYKQSQIEIKKYEENLEFLAPILDKKLSDINLGSIEQSMLGFDPLPYYRDNYLIPFEVILNTDENFNDYDKEDIERMSRKADIQKSQLDSYLKANDEIDKKLKDDITPNPITDMNSAGWLSPSGQWYGLNGTIANLLHNQIADALVDCGVVIPDGTYEGNPDGYMARHGWIKIHGDHVLYEGYMNKLHLSKPNIPMTKEQIRQLHTYAQHCNPPVLYFGFKKNVVTGARIELLDDYQLEKLFAF